MTSGPSEPPPRIPGRVWRIAAVTSAGAFLAMLDSTLANLAIESIRRDFGSNLAVMQWVATAYLIALAVSLPAAGWAGNRFGYGRVWAWALAAFVLASALCGLAPGPLTLIAARALQGLSGGLMIPAGQAVIGSIAGPKQLGRLMGVLGLVISLGPATGPALGGLLLEVASWRWLFWINLPVGVVALLLAWKLVPVGETHRARPLDLLGLLLVGVGLPLTLYGGTEIGAGGLTPTHLAAVVLGLVLTALFVVHARRSPSPLIDLGLLRSRTFATGIATSGSGGANMYGGLLLLPLYLQLVAGFDVPHTGMMLLANGLGAAVALPVAGILIDRFGAGPICVVGAAFLLLTTIPFLVPATLPMAVLIPTLILRGVGMAWAMMPSTTAAYAAVTPAQMGDASTLSNIGQRVGGALGAIAVVITLARAGGADQPAAYAWAFAALTLLSTVTLGSALLLRANLRRTARETDLSREQAATLTPAGESA